MFAAYMRWVDWIVRRINRDFSGGPIWRTQNNTQTLPMVAAIGIFVWVAVQTSSAPVAEVAIVLAVALLGIIIVTRVAGVTASQRWARLVAVVAAIRSAAYTRTTMLSRDMITPHQEDNSTPHAGAPPDHERAPRAHLVTATRPGSAGRRGAHSVARPSHRSRETEYAVTGGPQIAML